MESENRRKIALKRVISSSSSTSQSTPPVYSTSTPTSTPPPLPPPPPPPPPPPSPSFPPPPPLPVSFHHLLHLNAHLHRLKTIYNNPTRMRAMPLIPYRSGKQCSLGQPLKYRGVWFLWYSRGIVSFGSTRVLSWDSPCAS